MRRVVLLHGKDKTPQDVWYPWLLAELSKAGVECLVPALPHTEPPKIEEWLAAIDATKPDEHTTLVGHSRGGMAALRWLEKPGRKVSKVILIATNSATITDASAGDFYSGPYDFNAIRANCNDIIVMHSKNDKWVPYEAAFENTMVSTLG